MFERFTRSARTAVVVAQEEARELRSPRIEVEHLLLGLLDQGEPGLRELLAEAGLTRDGVRRTLAADAAGDPLGPEDAAALRSIGIDLDAVRETLAAEFGEDALDRAAPEPQRWRWTGGHIPFTKEAKKVLELALREALARKDRGIESGHVLLGILRAPNATTERLFGGAARVESLRPRVHELLDRQRAA
ncbi:Clp protease N-terminal domain-containing protein [Nocardia farcinica]|uniref:Clp protease N-terminal domain-containing protein n=1 Tax=Nocardia farcinica TaxID=37329 RepID=UPI001894E457|nr:Clp protease N-terminal domain-containing protein [Nocardia farcinica]MBF6254743.1 Clp protease [Nocardia farcinica]MBF6373670.1 Clp protease [Nocardia farcinica]